MHIVGEESWASEEKGDSHDQEEDVVIDAVGEESAITNLEAELDNEDEGVQQGGKLSKETYNEEEANYNLNDTIGFGIATRAGAFFEGLLITEIYESDTDHETNEERAYLLV